MFTGVTLVIPEYDSSRTMISAQIFTGQRVLVVRHCGILDPNFLCAECWGDLVSYMEDPAVVKKFSAFPVKAYVYFLDNACAFVLPFRSSGVLA